MHKTFINFKTIFQDKNSQPNIGKNCFNLKKKKASIIKTYIIKVHRNIWTEKIRNSFGEKEDSSIKEVYYRL